MSSNTKQVLAITLGSLGLAIGIFATVVAYNAKEATQSDSEVTAQVRTEFAAAQARQDAAEKKQVSDAESFVNQLNGKEKKLVKELNQIDKSISRLNSQVKTLSSRDEELASELSGLESDQKADYNKLNKRIDQTNADLNQLHRNVQNLRTQVDLLEASS